MNYVCILPVPICSKQSPAVHYILLFRSKVKLIKLELIEALACLNLPNNMHCSSQGADLGCKDVKATTKEGGW